MNYFFLISTSSDPLHEGQPLGLTKSGLERPLLHGPKDGHYKGILLYLNWKLISCNPVSYTVKIVMVSWGWSMYVVLESVWEKQIWEAFNSSNDTFLRWKEESILHMSEIKSIQQFQLKILIEVNKSVC